MAQWRKVIVSGSNAELNNINSSGNVVPTITDGGSLGTSALNWGDLFLDSGAVVNFDSSDVTLTHAANKLTLGGGNLEVGDNNVSGSSTSTGSFGYLNVAGDGVFGGNLTFGDAATDSVSFGADIDSNLIPNVDDTYDLGSATQAWQDLFIEGDITLTDAGSVKATAGNLTVDSEAATLVLDGHTGVDIDASNSGKVAIDGAGGIDIGVAADVAVDFNSSTFDLDASGAITIDGTSTVSIDGADDMNFTITSGTGGEDLTIAQVGANDSSIIITAAGTGADAVSIDATAGSMVIGATLVDTKTLTLGNTLSTYLQLTPHDTAASEKVLLYNASGSADDAIKIHSDAGGVTIKADNDSLHIDADGTDADALNIDSAGGIDVDAAAAVDILAASTLTAKGATGASLGDDTGTWEFDGSGALSETGMTTVSITPSSTLDLDAGGAITIDGSSISLGTDSDTAFDIDTSTLDIDSSGAITIDGTSTFSVDAQGATNIDTTSGTLSIGTANSGIAVSIGHTTSEVTVNDNLTVTGNATIAGDLDINGTLTTIDTTNLRVADRFILAASGSTSGDGGIIISTGAAGIGTALGYDDSASRWALTKADDTVDTATSITPRQYVVSVSGSGANPSGNPSDFGSAAGDRIGLMHVNTTSGDIFIFS